MNHNFGEKSMEYSAKQKREIPVWVSPKFTAAKKKAIEMIDSEKYGLEDADFWILMNETKSGKMGYTGLIISHNGCLKINDNLQAQARFRPECVSLDKEGWNNSLVYTYCSPEQGLYEVGEFSALNGKNSYPYAMALKRMFDRVVLKSSRLAYAGVMSEAESDEFKRHDDPSEKSADSNTPSENQDDGHARCEECGGEISEVTTPKGTHYSYDELIRKGMRYSKHLCYNCLLSASRKEKEEKAKAAKQKLSEAYGEAVYSQHEDAGDRA